MPLPDSTCSDCGGGLFNGYTHSCPRNDYRELPHEKPPMTKAVTRESLMGMVYKFEALSGEFTGSTDEQYTARLKSTAEALKALEAAITGIIRDTAALFVLPMVIELKILIGKLLQKGSE